jgi:hypothetical protein
LGIASPRDRPPQGGVAHGGGDTPIGTPIEGGVEMTSADLGTTNAWLAVIAIASLVQSLVIIGLVVAVFRLVRRTESAVEEVKREYLEPITTRTNKVIGEVEDALARFRSMDDRVSPRTPCHRRRGRRSAAAVQGARGVGSGRTTTFQL